MAARRRLDRRRDDLCAASLRKCVQGSSRTWFNRVGARTRAHFPREKPPRLAAIESRLGGMVSRRHQIAPRCRGKGSPGGRIDSPGRRNESRCRGIESRGDGIDARYGQKKPRRRQIRSRLVRIARPRGGTGARRAQKLGLSGKISHAHNARKRGWQSSKLAKRHFFDE